MRRRGARRWIPVVGALAASGAAAGAQTPTMPSTLRYGSGLIDVPVSSVLPHMHTTATWSGFFSDIGRRVEVDASGRPSGFGPGRGEFYSDGSVAVGLFDRAEAGVTVHQLAGEEEGGNVWGLFGRVRLWEPVDQGLGFAVGGRYLSGPSFGDGIDYAAGRLGFADERLRRSYAGSAVGDLDTDLSLYAVATAFVRGFDGGPLPENDLSFTLGYGGGMFRSGGDLELYSAGHSNGWFGGTALHLALGDASQLTVMAEHNGFDLNIGAHYDWQGVRVGAQVLATNHDWPEAGQYSEYQKPKLGFLVSLAICPNEPGFRCRPRTMRRVEPDTIYIPPPPPDTVVVEVEGAVVPTDAEEASICLSTGQNVPLLVTAQGDTLIGPDNASLRELRPALGFAGTYAGYAFWYQDDQAIVFEGGDFRKSDDTFPVDCAQILRVGIHEGVPVFAVLDASRPFQVIFIPVSPGVWQRYER
jgi:hypothetical protein